MVKTVRGLVIRQTAYKETDWILTVLSAEEGRLTVSVRGARKQGSTKAAASQILCYSQMQLSEYQERLSLSEAEILKSFPALRRDILTMALATYLCDLAALFMPEQEPAEDIFALLIAALGALSRPEHSPVKIKAATEFSALCRAGFAPELEHCAHCGQSGGVFALDVAEAQLLCQNCASERDAALTPGVLAALRFIQNTPISKCFSFTLNPEETSALSQICEEYFLHHAGRPPDTLSFYKGLIKSHE